MEREAGFDDEPEHEGDRYLALLGLAHLAYVQIPGRDIPLRDFLDICGDDARPMLVGFASLSPDDPRYEQARDILRTQVAQRTGIGLED